MTDQFFERPILNSPYEIPAWSLERDAIYHVTILWLLVPSQGQSFWKSRKEQE